MKHIFLLFYIFCLAENIIAQPKNGPDKLKSRYISLNAKAGGEYSSLPFRFIKVIDNRFDTSKIGFMESSKNTYCKLLFRDNLSTTLSKYCNNYYQSSASPAADELLIVIKKFWIGRPAAATVAHTDVLNFYLSWETYISRADKYLPFKRLDTVIRIGFEDTRTFVKSKSEDSDVVNIKGILKDIISGYNFSAAISVFDQRPTKTFEQIEAYNKKRFDLPVLKDTGHPRGVYQDFSQFVQNNPGVTNFNIETMQYRATKKVNYLTDSSGIAISKFWAYSDGSILKTGKHLPVILHRQGNTFEYFIPDKAISVTSLLPGAMGHQGNLKVEYDSWIPVQVDMETGKTY